MRNVIFVAPFPMAATRRFAAAIAGLDDVRLLGIWQRAPTDSECADQVVVSDALDPGAIVWAAERLSAQYGPIHRVVGILEDLQEPLAEARERLGVPGPSVRTARAYRDKAVMKDLLRSKGIPVAHHCLARSMEEAYAFVEHVGLPVVVKPPAGAGARQTERVDRLDRLAGALTPTPTPQRPLLVEEFLRGEEGTMETITIGGRIRWRSFTRYHPTPLEAMETPWIQWVVLAPKEVSGPDYDEVFGLGAAVQDALGHIDGMTHMEWFKRPDGSKVIGEIAARPPGAQLFAATERVHGADLRRAWARAVVDGAFDGPWPRTTAAAVLFLKGTGSGRVLGVDGLAEAQREVGSLVVEARLPQAGSPRNTSYEGDGYVIVQHPTTEGVIEAVGVLMRSIRVRYG